MRLCVLLIGSFALVIGLDLRLDYPIERHGLDIHPTRGEHAVAHAQESVSALDPSGRESSSASFAEPGSERALMSRLLAPCCWSQTLDVHQSPIADELRRELHQRLNGGEPASSIEDDFAMRYGERIRAVPRGQEPRASMALLAGALMLGAAFGLFLIVGRGPRKSGGEAAKGAPGARDLELEARIDAELARLDDV